MLYYYGWACLIAAVIFLALARLSNTQVNNVSAWIKPFKFAFSIALYAWTMAWYCCYLPNFNIHIFNWTIILLLGFEIIYIALQAARGQLSHFNVSTPLYAGLFAIMGLAATLVTLYTAYVCLLFFLESFPALPDYYLWAIRLGLLCFVIFSFEGAIMGGKLAHTIGAPDGGPGIPLLHWSTKFGDPRVAHFIGMHALQLLPLLSYYLLRNTRATIAVSLAYGLLASLTLVQALQGKPLFKAREQKHVRNLK